jgi:S-phase kinase-associated protein 1
MAMAEKRVKLKSSDDEMFEVDEAVAFESQAVKNMIEDTGMDHPIPLPNVSSKILAKVIEYCKYHVDNQKAGDDKPATSEDEIKAWDLDFVKVDQATLFDLILVSCVFCNTFSFPGLLVHLSCLPSFVTCHQFAAGGTYLVPLPATLEP